jgi:outer membrane lipoprotein-sorting protein
VRRERLIMENKILISLLILLTILISGCINPTNIGIITNEIVSKYDSFQDYKLTVNMTYYTGQGWEYTQFFKKPDKSKEVWTDQIEICNNGSYQRYVENKNIIFNSTCQINGDVKSSVLMYLKSLMNNFDIKPEEKENIIILKIYPREENYILEKWFIDKDTKLPLKIERYFSPEEGKRTYAKLEAAKELFERYFHRTNAIINGTENGYLFYTMEFKDFKVNNNIGDDEFKLNLPEGVKSEIITGGVDIRISGRDNIEELQKEADRILENKFKIITPSYMPKEYNTFQGYVHEMIPDLEYAGIKGLASTGHTETVILNYLVDSSAPEIYIEESKDPLAMVLELPSSNYKKLTLDGTEVFYWETKEVYPGNKNVHPEITNLTFIKKEMRWQVGDYYLILRTQGQPKEYVELLEYKDTINMTEMENIVKSTFICSDGTTYGQCSIDKPKYCDSGTLIIKCTQCGCPTNQSCNTTTENCYLFYNPVQQCSDGTPYGQCSSNKPKYCDNGNLINNCELCECPSDSSDYTCLLDKTCKATKEYDMSCKGTTCDGFCFTGNTVCNNDKIVYKDMSVSYFFHEKGEPIYNYMDVPFNVYADYPISVYPNETVNLNITIESTSSDNQITINSVNLDEWKISESGFLCENYYNGLGTYYFSNNTSTVLSIPSYTNKTISYILKAPPYLTPFGVRISIMMTSPNYGWPKVISTPITVYNIRNDKCGKKLFDPKVGICYNEILYPSKCEQGCNSNQICPDYLPFCVDHECEQRSSSNYFRANESYEIPVVTLYLLQNKTLADQLRLSERSYIDLIVSNATNWWNNEIVYWHISNFSINHRVIDCNISLDEYLSITQQYPNLPYGTYNEIISRCGINKSAYKIIAFFHIDDPNVSYPIYQSQNFKDIILLGGFDYSWTIKPNASDEAVILIHETLHSFGLSDLYDHPARMYYLYDCFMNTLDTNIIKKHLCPTEAFIMHLL